MLNPDTPIEYVKGVGPEKAKLLRSEVNIHVAADLFQFFPFRYVDRSKIHTIAEMQDGMPFIQLKGKFVSLALKGEKRVKRLVGIFQDQTGQVEVVWFKGARWVQSSVRAGVEYILFGKPTVFNGKFNIAHPEIDDPRAGTVQGNMGLQPVYHSTEKLGAKSLNSKGIERIVKANLADFLPCIPETLPEYVLQECKLPGLKTAYYNIHHPQTADDLRHAKRRLKFEELFFLQLQLGLQKLINHKKSKGLVFETVGNYFKRFYDEILPFPLTNAQKRVLKEIRQDCGTGVQMNRLLQGDVGSGKTIVGASCALMAIDNGYQVCLMAPTEILATQHYHSLKPFFDELKLPIALLTGSTKQAVRKSLHTALEMGELKLLIGTHALIEDKVKFQNLGLAIVDEQHRFGVAQRAKLWKKNTVPPHVLVMTATPIPRTLAMTLYGDLDVSVIDELPPGRKPIKTLHRFDSGRTEVFGFMEKEIAKGRQVYVVYPLIEESEALDYKDLMDGYESISRRFPSPKYQVSIVHGKMKPDAKDYEMNRFAKGETHIMVATTVIEVGVNVPNASIMVIESAEKFGLSQLHQLRGRVGRGAEQSFCVLMSGNKLSNDAKIRLKTMCDTNDGFKIAEVDLRLRGPGDVMGTQQSGSLQFKMADLIADQKILEYARGLALRILEEDPDLELEKNALLKRKTNQLASGSSFWSKVL